MDLRELPSSEKFRRHPWETARARFFRQILQELGAAGITDLLDVGSGDGWLAQEILKEFPGATATCWDENYREDDLGQSEGISRTNTRPSRRFDAVFLLDLLEHTDDDRGFLSGVVGNLAEPGAVFLVSVPAWQSLYCSHDAAFTHRRRYSPTKLREVLRSSGLTIVREGGLFHSLLPPRAIKVAKEKIFGPGKAVPKPLLWTGGELSARLLEAAMNADLRISLLASRRGIVLPGLSYWALCRKS